METFETFREIGSYEKRNMMASEPSCLNGDVSARKYKITIELIDEPVDVIRARIQKMWDDCENHHHWQSLKTEALKYGLELKYR